QDDSKVTVCDISSQLAGSSELVRTQRIVSAVLGQDVSFCCELTQPKDVLQVTWQKLTAHKPENIATYNKHSGARIINSLSGRLGFLQTGLQKCSVAIKGVTKEDETCYSCLFNSFPEGAIAGKTCLSVYEIYEPRFEVRTLEADAGEILSLTCSATGAPAPEISWNIKEEDILENPEEYSVTNPNGTITVTRNATVDISRLSATQILINCTVGHPGWENEMELSQLIRTGKNYHGVQLMYSTASLSCLHSNSCLSHLRPPELVFLLIGGYLAAHFIQA
ncbi:OX2G protein, partial [Atractosteus spatula]|nr:OX2G protein [Atractosteus spatula]